MEQKILEILWKRESASARDVCNALEEIGERKTYSTVRTILNRLVTKKVISQKLGSDKRTYVYYPKKTREEMGGEIVQKALQDLMTKFEKSTINYLSENLADNDEDIEKIKKKLKELKESD